MMSHDLLVQMAYNEYINISLASTQKFCKPHNIL